MEYFWISFKNAFVYRVQVIFGIISAFLIVWTTIALWNYVYIHNGDMQENMVIYTILANIIGLCYSNIISNQIAEKVYKGSFAIDLLRPVNFIRINFQQAFGTMMANIIIKGMPLSFMLFLLYGRYMFRIKIKYLGISFLVIACAIILYMEIYAIIGFMAFRLYEIWPINRLMNDTIRLFSGAFIPLQLFPGVLRNIAHVLPFRYLYSFPIELLLYGNTKVSMIRDISNMLIWVIICGVLLGFVYKAAIKKSVVQGG